VKFSREEFKARRNVHQGETDPQICSKGGTKGTGILRRDEPVSQSDGRVKWRSGKIQEGGRSSEFGGRQLRSPALELETGRRILRGREIGSRSNSPNLYEKDCRSRSRHLLKKVRRKKKPGKKTLRPPGGSGKSLWLLKGMGP